MEMNLAEPIKKYFDTTNYPDPQAFMSIFHKNAIVIDEEQEFLGITQIKDWADKHHFAAKVKLAIKNVVNKDNITIVTAEVDGDFDKTGLPDPLLLDFQFTIINDKISKLEIVF
jgi:hypothetical protein